MEVPGSRSTVRLCRGWTDRCSLREMCLPMCSVGGPFFADFCSTRISKARDAPSASERRNWCGGGSEAMAAAWTAPSPLNLTVSVAFTSWSAEMKAPNRFRCRRCQRGKRRPLRLASQLKKDNGRRVLPRNGGDLNMTAARRIRLSALFCIHSRVNDCLLRDDEVLRFARVGRDRQATAVPVEMCDSTRCPLERPCPRSLTATAVCSVDGP